MNEQEFQARVERLRQVNDVVKDLDPAIRADAFSTLKSYVTGRLDEAAPTRDEAAQNGDREQPSSAKSPAPPEGLDEDALVETHISDTDHENAMLALAIFYSRHGRGPFELANIKAIGQQYHLNMPARLDKFFVAAKRGDSNALVVRKQGDGWKIMPGGETWLKERYGVARGREPVPES